MSNIAEQLQSLAVPIGSFEQLPSNPRKGDVAAIQRSLERFGQLKPIVYRVEDDGSRIVIAGNHTLAAARQSGWDEIAAIDASALSEDEAKAFALADNRTAALGTVDDEMLREYLRSFGSSDESLWEAASYAPDEVNALLNTIARNHFDGLLDDLQDTPAAGFSEPMQPLPSVEGLVPFQVMMTMDQRRDVMAVLRADCDGGEADTVSDALLRRVLA